MGYYVHVLIEKVSFSVLVISSLILLLFCKNNQSFEDKLRNIVFKQLEPAVFVVRGFSVTLENSWKMIAGLWTLKNRNGELIKENFAMKLKLLEFDILDGENAELRNILNFISRNNITSYTIKKINTIANGGINHNIQFSFDKRDTENMSEHDLVLDKNGNLVGRVINIFDGRGEILLVSDYRSRIPAKLEKSGIKVILGGNGSNLLDIGYFFNNEQDAMVGENVYTSNDGDIIQEGAMVGKIIKNNGRHSKERYSVKLNSDLSILDFVIIVHRKF
ncbi:hypothetical protein FACS1894152_2490 [Bacilli bacterium]|nr:hypothetical protein FACS1894152_2490 [Bacilli bacterium]